MHSAESNGHRDAVKVLGADGADFNIRDHEDRTYLDLASDTGKPVSLHDAVNTIPSTISPQSKPPDVLHPPRNRGELEGKTSSDNAQCSVYAASMNGQLDAVRSLLNHSSDVQRKERPSWDCTECGIKIREPRGSRIVE